MPCAMLTRVLGARRSGDYSIAAHGLTRSWAVYLGRTCDGLGLNHGLLAQRLLVKRMGQWLGCEIAVRGG